MARLICLARASFLALAVLLRLASGYQVYHDDGGCVCEQVEVVSSNAEVAKKHGSLLGTYRLRTDKVNSRPSYEHFSGNFFLFYNAHSQGFWAVGERLNTDVVRLENQGDTICPYRMRSTWRFADGNLAALVYDLSLKVVCLDDPCSMAHCGHQARCVQVEAPGGGGGNVTKCECNPGFYGDPYDRCFPEVADVGQCQCRRLIFSSRSSVALAKHRNSYGEYFLYGEYDGTPVYQHFAGVEYLYKRDGNWLISDEVGLREAGLQNQGDTATCPYRFRTTWEYADIEQPGWQWVYDYTARLVCPNDPCSLTKCGFHASCDAADTDDDDGGGGGGRGGSCRCDDGYEGNAYIRCFPVDHPDPEACGCRQLTLSSLGASALAQADKMGEYFYFAIYNGRPAYQHRSGLDFLYYAEGNAWVIGAKFGGSRVGVVNFDQGRCPYALSDSWKHSVGGKLQVDASLSVVCSEDLGYVGGYSGGDDVGGNVETDGAGEVVVKEAEETVGDKPVPIYVHASTTTVGTEPPTPDFQAFHTPEVPPSSSTASSPTTASTPSKPPPSPSEPPPTPRFKFPSEFSEKKDGSASSSDVRFEGQDADGSSRIAVTVVPASTTLLTTTTSPSTTLTTSASSTTEASSTTPKPEEEEEKEPVTVLPVTAVTVAETTEEEEEAEDGNDDEAAEETTEDPKINLPCPCEEIFVNSSHPPTIEKHGAQLGRYYLYDLRSDRPVYKHSDREQYLYYHPYSGGNWLINYEIGLLYGGIQNSKDLPVCPYLVNTVWQYGDSELGGWVYDPSLTVVCPTDQCSVLKCGFRAQCVQDDQGNARCLCRKGFEGDPSSRCIPKQIDPKCPCKRLKFSSAGLAREHQRDKMGDYHLWGYYNGRPVYQHFSGLDFLYFHKNSVWGVGPKIGGNSAGLLNFGNLHCPYALRTPWEFGTKDKVIRRQIDSSLNVECMDETVPSIAPPPPSPPPSPPPPPQQRRPPIPPYQLPHQVVTYSSRASASTSNVLPPLHQQVRRGSIAQCGVRTILPDPEKLTDPRGNDRTVSYGSFPWQVRIALSERDPSTGSHRLRHVCSGALLSDRFVLTAARCLTSHPIFKYRVASGDHVLGVADPREIVLAIQSIYLHDLYDEQTGAHDLALAKVRAAAGGAGGFFDIGQFVMPACLPPPGSRYTKDVLCEASSWASGGGAVALEAAAVPVFTDDRGACGPRGTLCTGPAAGRDDFDCRMDAGTPLVCPTRRGATLVGILAKTSSSSNCVTGKRMPTEFVRVSDYVEWIEERLQL